MNLRQWGNTRLVAAAAAFRVSVVALGLVADAAHAEDVVFPGSSLRPRLHDMNGDGLLDLLYKDGAGLAVRLNDGQRGWKAKRVSTACPFGQSLTDFAPGDFTRDGVSDAVLLCQHSVAELVLLVGDRRGGLAFAWNTLVAASAESLEAEDLTDDGWPDVVFGVDVHPSGSARVLANTGPGTFAQTAQIALLGGLDLRLLFADFNLDGLKDFIAFHYQGYSPPVTTYLGDGQGRFTQGASLGIPGFIEGIAVGQFVVGRYLDLVVAWGIMWPEYHGTAVGGPGGFVMSAEGGNGLSGFLYFDAADLNGDGFTDLLGATSLGTNPRVYLSTGTGHFTPTGPILYPSGGLPQIRDIDRDGLLDVMLDRAVVLYGLGGGAFGPPVPVD